MKEQFEKVLKKYPEFGVINGGYDTHRPMLLFGLLLTTGDVLELGAGYSSTPLLHSYCMPNHRDLLTIEGNKEWADKFKDITTSNARHWMQTYSGEKLTEYLAESNGVFDLIFIDHAPGERRHTDLILLKDSADIILIHDSEPNNGPYNLELSWPHFKYRLDYPYQNTWTTAVSNTVDLSIYDGTELLGVKLKSIKS